MATDPDYEKNVTATFELPNSYLRHSKKIADEPDIGVDYNMDDQDMVSRSTNFMLSGYDSFMIIFFSLVCIVDFTVLKMF